MRGAVGFVLLAACGGGAARSADVGNRGRTEVAPAWRCPDGEELEVDLDGDGRVDQVRLAPSAEAVDCLEIHATTAPPLTCRTDAPPSIDQVDVADGKGTVVGKVACDPMGVPVRVAPYVDPDRGRVRRGEIESLGDAVPTGTALWLQGGDATAAIAWRGGWVWIDVGY